MPEPYYYQPASRDNMELPPMGAGSGMPDGGDPSRKRSSDSQEPIYYPRKRATIAVRLPSDKWSLLIEGPS